MPLPAALQCAPESLSYEGEAGLRAGGDGIAMCGRLSTLSRVPLDGNQLDLAVFWQQWLTWQAKPAEKSVGVSRRAGAWVCHPDAFAGRSAGGLRRWYSAEV
ncbi:hydrogenase maturation protein [Citrobacter freundii]|nr:hydrogenase maturation protein [Citrobacter freundii]